MRSDILIKIRNDENLFNYLKYHSYWYKELLRNPNSIRSMEIMMKKEYKLTLEDELEKLSEKVNVLKKFFDVLK